METKKIKKFKTVIGSFAFDSSFRIVARGDDSELKKKFGDEIQDICKDDIGNVLLTIRNECNLSDFYKKNLDETKKRIKDSTKEDLLVIQAINNIDDIEKAANTLVKRLREWYELYNPEFSRSIGKHEKFVEIIRKKRKKELLDEIGIAKEETMGVELSQEDLKPIMNLAERISSLYNLKEEHKKYIEMSMEKMAPNMTAITGGIIGAKLLEHVGSFKRLMEIPASTIQLLGAEKALFRHIVTGARCPKFGVIFNHPLVSTAKNKGKAARLIADKVSIAVKVDYFKGNFIGDTLRKNLEKVIK